MFEAAALLGLYAETPIHAGSGSERGVVDLPIQREVHTNLPMIPGSSLKGVIRASADAQQLRASAQISADDILDIFGPALRLQGASGSAPQDQGGAASFTDARLLLFPVRSLSGMFTWITSPAVLGRLARDAALCGLPALEVPDVPEEHAVIGTSSQLTADTLVFEDEDYQLASKQHLEDWEALIGQLMPSGAGYAPLRKRIPTRLAILSDGDFARLTMKGTAKTTRIRLNERGTTTGDGGNMWMEETLPSDALLYSPLLCVRARRAKSGLDSGQKVLDRFLSGVSPTYLQVGGNESVGQGWVRVAVARSTEPAAAQVAA